MYDTALITRTFPIPFGPAPSGTVGANGALTLGTALPVNAYANCWLFFPAGALYAGSAAGLYLCQMTSGTVGVAFNNTIPAGQAPNIPLILQPIVGPAPGAYTGITSLLTLCSIKFPGGCLGNSGSLEGVWDAAWTNNGNNKTFAAVFGGQTWMSVNQTTNASSVHQRKIQNQGSQQSQMTAGSGQTGFGVTSSGVPAQLIQDTSVDFSVLFNATLAVATDSMMYGPGRLTAYFGA